MHVDIKHGEEPVGSQRVSWDIAASPSLEILGARSSTCGPIFTRILIRVTLWLCLLCLCVTFVSFGSTFLALVLARLLVSAFCLGRFLDGGSLGLATSGSVAAAFTPQGSGPRELAAAAIPPSGRLHQDGRHAPGELHQKDHRDKGHVHGQGNHPVRHQQHQPHSTPHEERPRLQAQVEQASSWPWTLWPLFWVGLLLSVLAFALAFAFALAWGAFFP